VNRREDVRKWGPTSGMAIAAVKVCDELTSLD
jgi:hypothetical protein